MNHEVQPELMSHIASNYPTTKRLIIHNDKIALIPENPIEIFCNTLIRPDWHGSAFVLFHPDEKKATQDVLEYTLGEIKRIFSMLTDLDCNVLLKENVLTIYQYGVRVEFETDEGEHTICANPKIVHHTSKRYAQFDNASKIIAEQIIKLEDLPAMIEDRGWLFIS